MIELAFRFSSFSCKEKLIVLGMESRYDLILGITWLANYQPWIDWRTRIVTSSTQDTGTDVLPREVYATDVVTGTVNSALTGCQTSPRPCQLVETGVVKRMMTSSRASYCLLSCTEPRACGSKQRSGKKSRIARTGTESKPGAIETLH